MGRTTLTMRTFTPLLVTMAVFAPACLGLECLIGTQYTMDGKIVEAPKEFLPKIQECPRGGKTCARGIEEGTLESGESVTADIALCVGTDWMLYGNDADFMNKWNFVANEEHYPGKCKKLDNCVECLNTEPDVSRSVQCFCEGDGCNAELPALD